MTIKEIQKELRTGKTLRFPSVGYRGIRYAQSRTCKKRFLYWTNYGSSANRINELNWLLNTIFNVTAKDITPDMFK